MKYFGSSWLIVGSAVTGDRFFDAFIDRVDVTITTNAGWQYFLTHPEGLLPSYYWLSDHIACDLFNRPKRFMQARGTKILTTFRPEPDSILGRDLQDADQFIELPTIGSTAPQFARGSYVHPRLSGLVCLQVAVNMGASCVVCIGMDGYASSPRQIVRETFDGRHGKPGGQDLTRNWIAPFTQSIVSACPDVEFIFCGKLRYELAGANVTVIPTRHHLEEFMKQQPGKPTPPREVPPPATTQPALTAPDKQRKLPGANDRQFKPKDITTR